MLLGLTVLDRAVRNGRAGVVDVDRPAAGTLPIGKDQVLDHGIRPLTGMERKYLPITLSVDGGSQRAIELSVPWIVMLLPSVLSSCSWNVPTEIIITSPSFDALIADAMEP